MIKIIMNDKKEKVIIFDIDETVLIGTYKYYRLTLSECCFVFSISLKDKIKEFNGWDDKDFDNYKNKLNHTTCKKKYFKAMFDDEKITDEQLSVFEKLYVWKILRDKKCYRINVSQNCLETLKYLKKNGYKIIALSNSEPLVIKHLLKVNKIDEYFTEIIGYAEKPVICEEIKKYEVMLIIGDSKHSDGGLAKSVGCNFIHYNNDLKLLKLVQGLAALQNLRF